MMTKDDDDQLQKVLRYLCNEAPAPRSLEQRRTMTRLLIYIQRSPDLYRSSHPDFSEALNLTLEWVSRNIDQFKPSSGSVTQDLMRWVNGYLKWRIRDLYSPDLIYYELVRNGFAPIELDKPVGEQGSNCTPVVNLTPDPQGWESVLEQQIETLQKRDQERVGWRITQYIKSDPHGILRDCHPRHHPDCHCQEMVVRLHLQEPCETIRAIANRYSINEQTLYTHWRDKCLPLLHIIALRFDPQIKDYIEQASDDQLKRLSPQNYKHCHCQVLAEFFILSDIPTDRGTIAKQLNVPKSILSKHWQDNCLPLLKKRRLSFQSS